MAKANLAEKMKELEQVVEKLRQNELDIEEAVKLYESGIKLAAAIKSYLEEVQTKIKVLSENGEKEVDASKFGRKEQ